MQSRPAAASYRADVAHTFATVSVLMSALLVPSIAAAADDGGSLSVPKPPMAPESPAVSDSSADPKQADTPGTSNDPTASEAQEPPEVPEAAEETAPPTSRRAVRRHQSESLLASESRLDEQKSSEKPREWYGVPMIILDGLWLGAIGLGRAANSDETVILGTVGGITNGMLVHVYAHDSSFAGLGVGLLSVALRGALAGGGCALGSGCDELSDGALLRTSIGLAIGAGLDAAFLAYKPLFRPRPATGVGLVPLLSPNSVGGSVVGRF